MPAHWRTAIVAIALLAAAGAPPAWGQDLVEAELLDVESLAEWDGADDSEPFHLTNYFQPALDVPPAMAQPTARRGPPGSRQANIRLASVPNTFGDFGMIAASFGTFRMSEFQLESIVDLPAAGGSRRVKIAENNKPLPDNRLFFNYNHFHNVYALRETVPFAPGAPSRVQRLPIDRYTLGVEKMFLDDLWSVELRMPFNGSFDAELQEVAVSGGNIGNLAVILKRLLYADETLAVAAGMGIDTPTGSDVTGRVLGTQFELHNDALHLLPYVGFLWHPDDRWFLTGFLQVDIATGGNRVDVIDEFDGRRTVGQFTEQNLLYADLGGGWWLYRNPYAEKWTGVAALVEFHYTTSLQDTDIVVSPQHDLMISNPVNRFDVVNVTAGVQVEVFNTSNLRVGGAFPLGTRDDRRFFDAEVQVQFNRRF